MFDYGIVILNYNTLEDTNKCINSILNNSTLNFNTKIYIIDNCSPDKSGNILKEMYNNKDNMEVCLSNTNLGFSGGNNIGIKKAIKDGCKYIFLLNSDIVILNDAFKYMIEVLDNNDNVVAIGPTIVNKNDEYSQFARRPIDLATYIFSRKIFEKIFYKFLIKKRFLLYDKNKDFYFQGMVSGCCFGIKASFVKECNCLDDTVFMYYEEDILSYMIINNKKSVAIASKARVKHNEGVATEKVSKNKLLFTRFYRWASVLYVLERYAKVPTVFCNLIEIEDKIIWRILGFKSREYREKYKDFTKELKRVRRK